MVPQLLTELTLAMELPRRPTEPIEGIMVMQLPSGGTAPQPLLEVAAPLAPTGAVVLMVPP